MCEKVNIFRLYLIPNYHLFFVFFAESTRIQTSNRKGSSFGGERDLTMSSGAQSAYSRRRQHSHKRFKKYISSPRNSLFSLYFIRYIMKFSLLCNIRLVSSFLFHSSFAGSTLIIFGLRLLIYTSVSAPSQLNSSEEFTL